jgi:hypothetical protein
VGTALSERLGGFLPCGSGAALRRDTFQKLGGRLVVRVLRDKLAGEGVAEDGLAERLGGYELGVDFSFEVVDDGEVIFDEFDDGGLLGARD